MKLSKEALKLLGLSEDATEAEVAQAIAELGTRAAQVDDLETRLAAEGEARRAAADELARARAAREAELQQQRAAEIEALDQQARETGLWEPGSERQQLFQRLAAQDIELAREFVSNLQPANPVGAPSQSRGTAPRRLGAPTPAPGGGEVEAVLQADYGLDELNAQVARDQLRQLGVTPEQFAANGPHAHERRLEEFRGDWIAAFQAEG